MIKSMNSTTLVMLASLTLGLRAYAGTAIYSGTSAPTDPSWYADNEWNVSVWGGYAAPANDYPTLGNATVFFPSFRQHDTYLETDHAWGSGLDAKYFFRRYFGIGIQGCLLDVRQSYPDLLFSGDPDSSVRRTAHDRQLVGSVSATVTLRYPLGTSRFSPYLTAGGGFMFGGGQEPTFFLNPPRSSRTGSTTKAVGHFGGGVELRVTAHIGVMSDFSWSVVEGKDNNFGMLRSGINFAF